MQPRPFRVRLTVIGCALAALSAILPQAAALEPGRALTQYMHRVWQTQQGLPLAPIHAIYQTRDGYAWIGTESGLFRFDGVRFAAGSSVSDQLAADVWVTALLEDSERNLWISTKNYGLLRLRDGTVSRVSDSAGQMVGNVTCLAAGPDSTVFACTPAGVLEFRGGTSTMVGPGALAACVSRDGKLWFGGPGPELHVWDGRTAVSQSLKGLIPLDVVQTMLATRDGSLWAGTSDGLIQIKNGTQKRLTAANGLPANSILSLAEGQDGTLWIGTAAGFSRLRNNELENYTTKEGLSQSTIYSMLEDSQGSLWVGTKRGLNQFVDRHTFPITTNEGLPSNDTGPVLQYPSGTVWVGTIGAGLARYKDRVLGVLTTGGGLPSNVIYALAGGNSGDLWVGTDRGLNHLRQGHPGETLTTGDGLPSNIVKSLYLAQNGDLWIGTARGMATLRSGHLDRPAGRASGGSVVSIEGDRHGRVYAAVEGSGVLVFDEKTMREIPKEQIPVRNPVSLYHDGALWIGDLGGGMYLLDRGRLTEFLPKDGLFDDEIFGITSDKGGLLWMACSKGIFSVKREDFLQYAAGKIRKVTSTPYSPLEGVQTVECKSGVQPAVCALRDGQVLFSTIRGVLLMNPAQAVWRGGAPPRAVVEEVIVNGRRLNTSGTSSLAQGEQNVDFVYTGLDLRSPGRITFRYLLEGFNRNWVDAGARREASFTNLQPGRYRFRVMACETGSGCTEAAGPALEIPARFYQRAWFPFLAGGIVLALAWLAYLSRIRRLKRNFALTLAERIRIARELHDTLLQGFSGVTMEMQALAQRLPAASKAVLDDIIGDAVNCLRDVRLLLSNLRNQQPRQTGLAAAIERAVLPVNGGGEDRLELDLEQTPAKLPAQAEYNLTRIAGEAVANSKKHSGAGRITVALRASTDRIRLSVADNGCGFEMASGFEGHFGLAGMKERAAEIGANLEIESSPGEGTLVTVELPLAGKGAKARVE